MAYSWLALSEQPRVWPSVTDAEYFVKPNKVHAGNTVKYSVHANECAWSFAYLRLLRCNEGTQGVLI